MDSDNSHEQLKSGDDEEYNSNKNMESAVLATVESSAGDSYRVEHMSCDESNAKILNISDPKENVDQTEISSIAPFVSSGGVQNKPVTTSLLNRVSSDDKENINGGRIKFEEAKKNKKEMAPTDGLNAKSLRELSKLLREKLQIASNTTDMIGKVMKERPALQKLEDNCQP